MDVEPLHQAVTKLLLFYQEHGIDLLKEVLTLSGAANKILHSFNTGEAIFLFPGTQKALYQQVRKQIVGGPSLVFSRSEKAGVTTIGAETPEFVQSIVG